MTSSPKSTIPSRTLTSCNASTHRHRRRQRRSRGPLLPHDFLEGADLLGRHNHPEISMHSRPFAEYVKCICANERAGAAELMLSSPQKRGKT